MPTSTSSDPTARLPYAGLAGDVFATARQAAGAAAHTYLAGLDAVAGAQRRLAAGTPLAPVSEILGAQVKLTRRVVEGFVTGEAPASPGAVAKAVEEAAPAPARPARKPQPRKPAASARAASTTAKKATAPAKKASAHARKPAAKSTARPAGTASAATRTAAARSAAATTAAAKTAAAAAPVTAPAPAPASAEPFSGYSALTAEQVIARLPELSQRELKDAQAYEAAHGARQTVVERIAGLTAHEPLPGYDELTVEDIRPRLADGGPALAARVLQYERRHKQRDGVLEAAQGQVAQA
jgi:hypothetical protein